MTATDPEREAGRAAAHRATVILLLLTIAAPLQARGDVCFGDCAGRFEVGADDLRAIRR